MPSNGSAAVSISAESETALTVWGVVFAALDGFDVLAHAPTWLQRASWMVPTVALTGQFFRRLMGVPREIYTEVYEEAEQLRAGVREYKESLPRLRLGHYVKRQSIQPGKTETPSTADRLSDFWAGVEIINQPVRPSPTSVANEVYAEVSYVTEPGETISRRPPWVEVPENIALPLQHSLEPPELGFGPVTISVGARRILFLARWRYPEETMLVGAPLHDPFGFMIANQSGHVLPKGTDCKIVLRLVGVSVDERFELVVRSPESEPGFPLILDVETS